MSELKRIRIRLPKHLVEKLQKRAEAAGTDVEELIHLAVATDLIGADLRQLCVRRWQANRARKKKGNHDGGGAAGRRAARQR